MAKTTLVEAPVAEQVEDSLTFDELRWSTVELADLNNQLPIGIFVDGRRLREFKLRSLTMRDRLNLGKIAKGGGKSIFQLVPQVLQPLVVEIEGHTIPELGQKLGVKPSKVLSEYMAYGDVMAILFACRLEDMGGDIALNWSCQRCGHENEDNDSTGYHDIGSAEVKRLDGVADSEDEFNRPVLFRYTLNLPINYGKEEITYFNFRPWTCADLASLDRSKSDNDQQVAAIMRMVHSIPESAIYSKRRGIIMDEPLLERISLKKDFGPIRKYCEQIQLTGLHLTSEQTCANCSHKQKVAFPWDELATFLCESMEN